MELLKSPPCFKLLLVGEAGVGKTCFIKKHLVGEFEKRYLASSCVESNLLKFYTNFGSLWFDVWDISTSEMNQDMYYVEGQCAIIMFDLTSQASFDKVGCWVRNIRRVCGDIPIVLCGNKCDCSDKKVLRHLISELTGRFNTILKYYPVSCKSNVNFEAPFLCLARCLVDIKELVFVYCPTAGPPPEVELNPEELAQFEADLLAAQTVPLPDYDDDL